MKDILQKYCNNQNSYGLYISSTSEFEYKLIKSNKVRVYFLNFFIKDFTSEEKLEMFFKSLQ